MAAYGALEAYNYSFINYKVYDKLRIASDDPRRNVIRIINPLSEEFGVMRTQLVGSMLNSVYVNTSRKNNDFRLFEVARTYIPKSLPLTELPEEHDTLCAAFVGKSEDFYALKSVVGNVLKNRVKLTIERSNEPFLHSGISIDLFADGKNSATSEKFIRPLRRTSVYPRTSMLPKSILAGLFRCGKDRSFQTASEIPHSRSRSCRYGKRELHRRRAYCLHSREHRRTVRIGRIVRRLSGRADRKRIQERCFQYKALFR